MWFVELWQNLPNEIKVFLISMSPFFELRASIPIGIFVYHMSPIEVLTISVLGNILVLIPVKIFLNCFVEYLMKVSLFLNKIFTKVFEKTRNKHSKKMKLYGAIALVSIVAIPIPGTGGWTGALLAYLFDIPVKKSLPLISIGILIAGIIVLAISGGVHGLMI